MNNYLGEKELLTYELENNLFSQSIRISKTVHTELMEAEKEVYVRWQPNGSDSVVVPKRGKLTIKTGFPWLNQEEVESELAKTIRNMSHTLDEPYYPEIARYGSS